MSNTTIKTQQNTQLPDGYKQTAVGIIPEDWEVEKFKNNANFFSGGTPSTVKLEYYNGIIPFIKSGEIYNNKTEQFLSEIGVANSSAKLVEQGDLLYALYGANSGEVAISKINGAINQAILCIRPNHKFEKTFLYNYFLEQKAIILKSYLQGGQGNLSAEIIKNLIIPIPPLPEQQKIAEILSTWDNAIDNCKKIIKKLKKRNKGLAQQLLSGKTRVKGFEYTKWENKRLKDIALRVTAKNEELNDTVVTISAQRGFVLQEDFFNKRVASDTLLNYYLLKKGQFAYNKSYSNGYPMGAFKRLDNFEKAVVTTLYICFELKKNVDSDFMNYFFENGMMVNYLMKVAQEGGRAHGLLNIGLDDFFNLKLTIPSKDEQEKIANILDNATNELKQYEQKLANLQLQKKGLMQQLLTGKVRVKLNK